MKLRHVIWGKIKKIKDEKDISYGELSKSTGISNTTLRTLFSGEPNYRVGKIIEISKVLKVGLPQIFGEKTDKSLAYPETEEEAVQNFWKSLDSYYMNSTGSKYYSRKRIYREMGKSFYKAVREDKILLSLDVLEQFSNHLKISPLRLVSQYYSIGEKLHFRKQNSLVCLHLQSGKMDVATFMIDGDHSRYKVEDWLMGMLTGAGERVLVLNDMNNKKNKLRLEWNNNLKLSLEIDGQELYSQEEEKEKANELLTKISRKEQGYESYLDLLEEKENS